MLHLKRNQNDPIQNAACAMFKYNGKKLSAEVINGDTFTMSDTSWSGGSRTSYGILNIATMSEARLPNFHPVFDGQVISNKLKMQPGFIIVQHDIYRGKDIGLRFHVHPEDWNRLELPQSNNELSQTQLVVLKVTRELKSFARTDEARRYGVTTTAYVDAKAELIKLGYLAQNGAVTVEGRNVTLPPMSPNLYR